MAGHAAFAAGFTRFFAGPLVGRALLMRSLAALARNLALFGAVHRGESAILFSHTSLPESLACPPHSARGEPVFAARRAPRTAAAHVRRSRTGQVATDVPRLRSSPSGRGRMTVAVSDAPRGMREGRSDARAFPRDRGASSPRKAPDWLCVRSTRPVSHG